MNTSDVLVHIGGVRFSYNRETVLDRINLDIVRGDFVGIIGPNGSGKTTLLKIMLGLLAPQSGRVALFGKDIGGFNEWHRVGYVPQKATAFDVRFPVTVEEVVGMGRTSRSKYLIGFGAADESAIREALGVVGMYGHRRRLVTELSGGEQQRVFIARALASRPELLILDEPTVGVDIEAQAKFYNLLKELNERMNLTLVLVSHDIDVVANEVKTLACLNRSLIYHGAPKDFITGDYLRELYGKDIRFILHGH